MANLNRSAAIAAALAALPAEALAGGEPGAAQVHPAMIAPFVALLLAIALMPFINRHWWEKRYPLVSIGLGLVPVAYYVFVLGHASRMLDTGLEYLSFIVLIGSLFVVSGGIHIRIRGKSTPLTNAFLLAVGAVVSNILGTTGASMILIRPYLRVNRYRLRGFHVVFFIFIVSNIGGALTPIGDPPLFLGYLEGVPFFWVLESVWPVWLITVGMVLAVFLAVDAASFRRFEAGRKHVPASELHEEAEVGGMHNVFFLTMILVAVFVQHPPFVREALMLAAAAGSWLTTGKEIHRKNEFTFGPIREVGLLFLGIFATMVPALDWLQLHAPEIGITSAGQFYWGTGILSSVLDNAPTYLNFLSAAIGLFVDPAAVAEVARLAAAGGAAAGAHAPEIRNAAETLLKYHGDSAAAGAVPADYVRLAYLIANHDIYLKAISMGAVFFGAMTYIGNGPNFMVKSIAEQSGVRCPSFFGYVAKYSAPVLLPVFAAVWLLFFRG